MAIVVGKSAGAVNNLLHFFGGMVMKRLCVVLSILLVSQFALGGVEFVGVDGVETTFDAGTGELTMDGSSLVITIDYDGATPQDAISLGTFELTTMLVSGNHFEGGTFAFADTSGTLLSGDIVAIDFAAIAMFDLMVGSGSATVLVENLDGDLLGDAEIVSITFQMDPAVDDFTEDFSGLSKVNFVVPEPATLGLLGLGGLLFVRKRK